MSFPVSRRFRQDYDRIFQKNPQAANLFFLMCELADKHGRVNLGPDPEEELARLMAARLQDRWAYQLPEEGEPKR